MPSRTRSTLATRAGPRRRRRRGRGRAGGVDEPGAQVERVRRWLAEWGTRARELEREDWIARLREKIAEQGEELGQRLEQAAPPDQLWLGLERYWRKRAEREREEAA